MEDGNPTWWRGSCNVYLHNTFHTINGLSCQLIIPHSGRERGKNYNKKEKENRVLLKFMVHAYAILAFIILLTLLTITTINSTVRCSHNTSENNKHGENKKEKEREICKSRVLALTKLQLNYNFNPNEQTIF